MFQEKIKELRKEAKLTQKQIAEKLDMPQSLYSNLERGIKQANQKRLKQFSDFYNVSTDYLLGNTDIKSKTLETDLNKTLDTVRSFDGKPITDADRETIREILKRRQLEREQKADN
ncbi:XRE family transcriptional regulator [Lactococcus raffinolactis]|jgi:transcriptional regulator with XRE-family HTH domain|uniref:helix-turn-helix domain-containing protein n=1 Tax=Pseudolactococcus raffinolactis TaxID=1366 RepID=UPI001C7047F7|nr:helix-turn-helix transcriptional regulator [Lactococcus raffinolactis]MBW9331749.1 XRE family transcriptional regulator [Lactococcus raffinolactis]